VNRSLLFWAVVLTLPILHFFLHVGFGFGGRAPDLLTVALLLVAREVRTGTAAGVGFAFGLLEDAFSILAFGANTLAMTLVGIAGAWSRDLLVGESVVFLVSYLTVGAWLRFSLHWIFAGPEVRGPALHLLGVQAPVAALYAAGVGVLILLMTGAWREPAR
jgi:rod shape-determining protein MreD